MCILYESYTLVKTIDPARRTPVIPSVDEKTGVVEVGLVEKLQTGNYSHWWSFGAGVIGAYFVFSAMGRRLVGRGLTRVTR